VVYSRTLFLITLIPDDLTDRELAHTKLIAKRLLRYIACRIAPPDLSYLVHREFGSRVLRTSIDTFTPTLEHAVANIRRVCANPEMFRVDTPAIVTGMATLKTFRDGTMCENPREPVGVVSLPFVLHLAITKPVAGTCPFPATVWPLPDFRPESRFSV
jgi:hypothetical protein